MRRTSRSRFTGFMITMPPAGAAGPPHLGGLRPPPPPTPSRRPGHEGRAQHPLQLRPLVALGAQPGDEAPAGALQAQEHVALVEARLGRLAGGAGNRRLGVRPEPHLGRPFCGVPDPPAESSRGGRARSRRSRPGPGFAPGRAGDKRPHLSLPVRVSPDDRPPAPAQGARVQVGVAVVVRGPSSCLDALVWATPVWGSWKTMAPFGRRDSTRPTNSRCSLNCRASSAWGEPQPRGAGLVKNGEEEEEKGSLRGPQRVGPGPGSIVALCSRSKASPAARRLKNAMNTTMRL